MTDESIMPFGAHKGKRLADVPDKYLLWLWDRGQIFGELKAYIEENLEAIKLNIHNGLGKR